MTDNRTTDELIRLLEERGVKYEAIVFLGIKAVVWDGNVCRWIALPDEDEDGLGVAVYKSYLTPEQAIAATLGSGNPTSRQSDTFHDDFYDCESTVDSGEDTREKLESDCQKLIEKIQKRTFSGRDATALRASFTSC